MEVWQAVVVGVAALALMALRLGIRKGALQAGQAARRRTIERTGDDPADNPVNNGVNAWADRHPVGYRVVLGLVCVLAALLAFWRVLT